LTVFVGLVLSVCEPTKTDSMILGNRQIYRFFVGFERIFYGFHSNFFKFFSTKEMFLQTIMKTVTFRDAFSLLYSSAQKTTSKIALG